MPSRPYGDMQTPDTLKTLPQEQFLCGCGEVIKYAVFGSGEFFERLSERDVEAQLEYVITKSVEMKRDVVACDERDTGARMILRSGSHRRSRYRSLLGL